MGELIKVLPDIIKEASQSTLGIFALLVVVLGLLAWRFFQHASIRVRIVIWSLILAGTIGFAVAFVRASHDATGATSVFNVETRIKEWLSLLKVVPRKVDVSDSLIRIGGYTHPGAFGYEITTRENDKMTLWRETKERPEYLQVWSYLPISPQDQALLNTLTREQRLEVARTVAQDLNKVPMGNKSLPEYSEHFTGFLIAISVPLATLTRYTFGDDIDKVDNATVIARNDLAMSLEPFRHLSSTALPPAPAIQLGRPFLGVSELALVKNDQGTWIAQKGTIVVSGSTPAHDVRAIVGAYARFDYSFNIARDWRGGRSVRFDNLA